MKNYFIFQIKNARIQNSPKSIWEKKGLIFKEETNPLTKWSVLIHYGSKISLSLVWWGIGLLKSSVLCQIAEGVGAPC